MKRSALLLPLLAISLIFTSCGETTSTGSGSLMSQKQVEFTYKEYNAKEFFEKRGHEPILLFFAGIYTSEYEAFDNLFTRQGADLRGKLIIYKIDYDMEPVLRSEFGVAVKNTFVAIDASGRVQAAKYALVGQKDVQTMIDSAVGAPLQEDVDATSSAIPSEISL